MDTLTQIRVTTADFDLATEYQALQGQSECGAIVSFVGTVRELASTPLLSMTLEHYPAMTEKSLAAIVARARQRWPLGRITVIHRVGTFALHDQIVLVLVSSAHRNAAFAACEFIMDYLKTQAPFWKKEHTAEQTYWVAAKPSDQQVLSRWQSTSNSCDS